MIVGVLSQTNNFNERHAIRGTWAAESQHRVFFIVAGPWEAIEDEFIEYGDILWLNMEEYSPLATSRVQLLPYAVHKHVSIYDYIIKINDDSYIRLDDVQRHLADSKPGFWGNCHNSYHTNILRYTISRDFNECAIRRTKLL